MVSYTLNSNNCTLMRNLNRLLLNSIMIFVSSNKQCDEVNTLTLWDDIDQTDHFNSTLSVPSIYGAFVRPDLSNECTIPNILKALRFRLHFHCIFLFPCISKQAFNKCPFSTHEMCSSCHLTNHFFPQPFFGSSFK